MFHSRYHTCVQESAEQHRVKQIKSQDRNYKEKKSRTKYLILVLHKNQMVALL